MGFCAALVATASCDKSSPAPPEKSTPAATQKTTPPSTPEAPTHAVPTAAAPVEVKPAPTSVAPAAPVAQAPASPLPEATRGVAVQKNLPESYPADLPENPDIPRPFLTGLSPQIARQVVLTYTAAVKNPQDAAKVGELGMVLYRLALVTEAVKCFSLSTKLEPKSLKWNYYLGLAAEAAFDPPTAIAALKQAEKIAPTNHAILLKLGDLSRATDTKSARAYYRRAMELVPNDPRISYGLAMCDLAEGKKPEAIKNFSRAVELAPRYADAHLQLYKYFESIGDKKAAQIHRAMADQGIAPPVILDPLLIQLSSLMASSDGLLVVSKQLVETGQTDLAIEILERGLRWDPDAWDVRQQLGVIYLQLSRFPEAISEFKAALLGNPTLSNARVFLAQALVEVGQYPEAEKMLKASMNAEPDQIDPAARYADFLLTIGRAGEAEEMYSRLTRADPGNIINYLEMMVAQVYQKKYVLAANRLNEILRNLREGHDVIGTLASQFMLLISEQTKPDPAHARKANIELADIYGFADYLDQHGQPAEGKKLRSLFDTVAANLVDLANRGELAEAVRSVQRYLPVDRGGRFRDAFRTIYLTLQRKHPDVAAGFIRDCLQNAETSPHLAIAVAWIRATSSDAQYRDGAEAVRLAEKASAATHNADAECLDALAAAYAETGRFDDAVRTAQQAIRAATDAKSDDALAPLKTRLALYELRKAYRAG